MNIDDLTEEQAKDILLKLARKFDAKATFINDDAINKRHSRYLNLTIKWSTTDLTSAFHSDGGAVICCTRTFKYLLNCCLKTCSIGSNVKLYVPNGESWNNEIVIPKYSTFESLMIEIDLINEA